jgi:class 3 adenylate cyclase/tetratricopeptide (TPR) repeat protein
MEVRLLPPELPVPWETDVSEIACPSCESVNPAANRFCGVCGTSLARPCPSCGAENPAGNRFCGTCGSPLDGPAAESGQVSLEERKVVTVLFADLTASTEMASRLDPEDLRGVLGPFFDAMREEIARYGGTVEKFIGDAVVAVFGAPVAHEDDPERAVRSALAMHLRLDELNREIASRAGGDLAMRIGVNTGDVITHSLEEGIVTGEAVNIAARFQTLATPGRIVVGERTHRDIRAAFAFTELDRVTVKGIDRPLRVWQVESDISAPRAAMPAHQTPFVGRGSEVELLRLLFERTVRDRRPNLVTIIGPPGIGKSRLSHEVARELGGDATRVVRGRCLPYGDGLTYWPLAEILKSDAGILDSDAPDAILWKARASLNPRFSGDEGMGLVSVLLSSIGVDVPSDPLAGTDPDAARRVIVRAWQRYLESMTAEGPVLALVEDLHWADPSLLELLEAVVARASGPALVLCMARPDLFERRPDWGGGLSNATTLSLSPLSAGEGAALIENLLDGEAPTEVVGAILHRSEGNPFFAGELLRMMLEDGTLARRDDRWRLVRELPSTLPDTVQGVIASRIDLLPPAEKRAIQDASVVGRIFWQGALERLGSAGAESAIDALIAKGLVWERESSAIAGERELIFNHILTRDVAYGSIPRARRLDAHTVVGTWVEEVTHGRAEEFSEILAYHFERAGDAERTARFAMLAGNRHLRVFAAEQAIEWFDRAMEAGSAVGPAIRGEIAFARATASEQLGRFEQARADYERARSEAEDAGDAEQQARAIAAIAHVLWLLDRYDQGQELLPVALERANAVGLPDVEARLLYTAGTMHFGRGEYAESLRLHRQALAVAEASGDLEGQSLAHHGLAESHSFHGPFRDGLAHGERADELLRELGQRSMVAHNGYMVGWTLWFLGRTDEALSTVETSVQTAHEIGNRRDEGFALYCRSQMHLSAGRLDVAWGDATASVAIFRELGLVRGEIVGLSGVDDLCAEVRDHDGLAANATALIRLSDELGGSFMRPAALASLGAVALAEGRSDDAEAWFGSARAFDDVALNVGHSGRAEVLGRELAGDAPALRAAGERLAGVAALQGSHWGAWGTYALALAALADGMHDEAFARAEAAVEEASSAGGRRLEWRAGRVAWLALVALGRGGEAERFRKEASTIVEDEAAHASGHLRDAFLARPDVAELLA